MVGPVNQRPTTSSTTRTETPASTSTTAPQTQAAKPGGPAKDPASGSGVESAATSYTAASRTQTEGTPSAGPGGPKKPQGRFSAGKKSALSKAGPEAKASAQTGAASNAFGPDQHGRTESAKGGGLLDQVRQAARTVQDAIHEATRPTPTQVSLTRGPNGSTVLDAGAGNDNIRISQLRDGRLRVTTNGESVTLSHRESQNLVIRGGAGNDRIRADSSVTQNLRIEGGEGNDRIRGGRGHDTILGGAGNDRISGGRGNDLLAGGDGVDRLSGGRGSDRIYSQADDRVRAGRSDTVTNVDMGRLNNAGNPLGSQITVNGTPEFQARVQSDIDAMRSIPYGQNLLASMDNTGRRLTISETTAANGFADIVPGSGNPWIQPSGANGPGADAVIQYNPTFNRLYGGAEPWQQIPPIVILAHEMVHTNDYMNGTLNPGQTGGVNNRELAAVGLPFDRTGDGVPDPNNKPFTENGMRDFLGLPLRPVY